MFSEYKDMKSRLCPSKSWLPLSTPVCCVLNMQPTYCGLCDMWFSSQRSFDAHLVLNEKHPSCDKCDRKFADRLAYLKVAYRTSPLHPYWGFKVQCLLKPNNESTAPGVITKAPLLFALWNRSQQRFGTQSGKVENFFVRRTFNHSRTLIAHLPM